MVYKIVPTMIPHNKAPRRRNVFPPKIINNIITTTVAIDIIKLVVISALPNQFFKPIFASCAPIIMSSVP
ncbi:hypothetical protein D3C75_1204260 [compost metagenome]